MDRQMEAEFEAVDVRELNLDELDDVVGGLGPSCDPNG